MSDAQPRVELLEKRVRLWRIASRVLGVVVLFLGWYWRGNSEVGAQ